jgi:putative hydrolase of the HAD superfamily
VAVHAVVFDVGGVLEITPDLGVMERWATRANLSTHELAEKIAESGTAGTLGTITEAQVRTALATRLGVSEAQMTEMMTELWEQYLGTPNTELIDFARRLRPQCRTGILSNSFVGAREREQDAYGLTDLVDVVIYSHEVGLAKPDPRIYELTCRRLAIDPDEMVFLDDIEECVTAACDFGIRAVHYRDNQQAITEIEKILAER